MLSPICLLAVGFAGGVVVTGILALRVYGLLRAETARILEDHCLAVSGVTLVTYPGRSAGNLPPEPERMAYHGT